MGFGAVGIAGNMNIRTWNEMIFILQYLRRLLALKMIEFPIGDHNRGIARWPISIIHGLKNQKK